MGAYLAGEKLELGRNKYKIKQDVALPKLTPEYGLPTDTERTIIELTTSLMPSKSLIITIDYENILLTPDLEFSNISTIENIDVSKFSFENSYLCYISADTHTTHVLKYVEYKDVFDISFELDNTNKQIIVKTTKKSLGAPGEYSTDGEIRWGGIWGLLKYEDKYVFYSTDSAVKYGTTYPSLSDSTNFGSLVERPRTQLEWQSANVEDVANITSGDEIVYQETGYEQIGYFLTTYWSKYTSSETDLAGKPITGSGYFDSRRSITLKVANRRIENE